MDDLLELDEQVLTVALQERAATAERQAVTWAYRTNGWHSCEWPREVRGSTAPINSRRGSRLFGVLI